MRPVRKPAVYWLARDIFVRQKRFPAGILFELQGQAAQHGGNSAARQYARDFRTGLLENGKRKMALVKLFYLVYNEV